MEMPPLETARLLIRPFTFADLDAAVQLLDIDLAGANVGAAPIESRAEREQWLRWTVLNYDQLARLYQPPYGDRAVVLKSSSQLIGAVGYVPCLAPFQQYHTLRQAEAAPTTLYSTEFGLYYAFAPAVQRQGYATEAASALIGYAFNQLRLGRVIAQTSYDNLASMGVMRKLGMQIERNPYPDPPWLQIVGVLANPAQEG